jgi:hypothetical protein
MCVHVPQLAAARTSNQMRLLASLSRELLWAERAIARNLPREAERLGSSPPAMVLRAVAGHASDAATELMLLRDACEIPSLTVSQRLILFLSTAKTSVFDSLLPKQMAYRACLAELHRGVDTVRLMRSTARVTGYLEIADWCDSWLSVREPLLDLSSEELSWFAENPSRAMARASLSALARA